MNYTSHRFAVAVAAAVVLSACGGGADEAARAGALELASRATPDAPRSDRLRALSATPRPSAPPVTIITNAELFAFAQAQFPALFPGTPQQLTVPYDGKTYDVRAYSGGNYIGITNTGEVYGLGSYTGNQLVSFGTLASLTCTVAPARCQTPPPPPPPTGQLNECIDPRSASLPTGFRMHLIYVYTSGGPVANFELTSDTVVDGSATFEGQSAVQVTTTSMSSITTSIAGQGSTTVNTTATTKSYEQPSNNGLLKTLGHLNDTVSTTTISIPGSPFTPPPTTTTTRGKTVATPPYENVEFTLAVGQSVDKPITLVTTLLQPAAPPTTTSTTTRHTFEARETIAVQGRSFDTCRYKISTIGGTDVTTSWFIVGKGVPARVQSTAGSVSSNMELKQGSTYDGQPL